MNKSRVQASFVVLAAALCSGCHTWPLAPQGEKDESSSTKTERPGRAAIRSTGVDERSREIERSLGAR